MPRKISTRYYIQFRENLIVWMRKVHIQFTSGSQNASKNATNEFKAGLKNIYLINL